MNQNPVNKKSGFERLRGLAAAGVAATAGLFAAGTARAATVGTNTTVTVSSVGGVEGVTVTWDGIGNDTMSSFDAYTTTGGAVQTMAYGGSGIEAFGISDGILYAGNSVTATSTTTYTTTYTTTTQYTTFTYGPSSTPFTNFFTNTFTYTSTYTNTYTDTYATYHGDAFDRFFSLAIGDQVFTNPGGSVDLTDNTLTSGVATDLVPGVDAQVQYRFFTDRAAVRAVFALTNTTDDAITVPAVVFGNYGSDSSTTVQATADGDLLPEDNDFWYLSNQSALGEDPAPATGEGGGGDPAVLLLRYGKEAKVKPIGLAVPGDGSEDFADQYNITIKPGATVRIMMFAQLGATNDAALAGKDDLTSIAAVRKAGLLDGLSEEEVKTIVNFGKKDDEDDDTFLGALPLASLLALGALFMRRRRKA